MNSQQGLLHTQGPCGALADGPEIFTIKDTSTSWSLPRLALPPRELGVSVAQNSYPWAKSQAPRYCSLTSWCSHNPLSLAPRLLGEAGEKRRYLPIISLRPCNPARGTEGREGGGGGRHAGTKGAGGGYPKSPGWAPEPHPGGKGGGGEGGKKKEKRGGGGGAES